jgi:alpha-glucosidase (family GH31 glycosyl hydrolase)
MYDFGEYVQPEVLAGNGMTGEELHNLWPALYDQAGYEALEAGPAKGDWFFFARSGYTGAQKWTPMVWGGDPESSFDDGLGLPSIIRGGTNMGLSGVAHWGSDVGGFKCISGGYAAADGEMLTRWIEAGALMSNMQDQNACPGAKDSGIKASIWNSADAQAAWKTYARLHTRLFPYMYTLAKEANVTGAPTMRHPFFEHPTRDFAAVDDAYYFGPSLLVAPVVRRGARGREVMLPATSFLDWTATPPSVVSGPGKKVIDVPLGRLPVLIKSGALVPLLDETIDTLDDREMNAQVVGPKDVAGVYDVVGFLGIESASASFTAHDGSRFSASLPGAVPAGPAVERVSAKLVRVRASIAPGGAPFVLGALRLEATSSRTVRFEIFVAEP